MRLAVAQIKSDIGNIEGNISKHIDLIQLAVTHSVDCIVFPELSLTGYEPDSNQSITIAKEDERLAVFRQLSETHVITIMLGAPVPSSTKPTISMLIFQPGGQQQVYTKNYLHPDETSFFSPGTTDGQIKVGSGTIAVAICYEISVDEHLHRCIQDHTAAYIASVAKTDHGIEAALDRLATLARSNNIPVLMSNCIGRCEGTTGAGRSGAWDQKGESVAQLDGASDGLVYFDLTEGKAGSVRF